MTRSSLVHRVVSAGVVLGLSYGTLDAQRTVQRSTGQNVAPVYDGYEANPDGTFSMWFGYFNRNHEEALEIPIGPDNRFEPGVADRGQPTHFVPEWQKSTFRVIVPADFGQQKLTWRLTSKGKTEVVTASLEPRSIIDRQETTLEGTVGLNKAPTISLEAPAEATLAGPITVSVSAADDGLPLNSRTKKPEGLSVRWRKYRGPQTGRVTFTPGSAKLENGKSATTVRFTEPGDYVLQGVVDDGSLLAGTYCCWVSREVRIKVK